MKVLGSPVVYSIKYVKYVHSTIMHCFVVHGNVIKWRHFSHYWPFVRGIHRSPVNSPHKGHWGGALMFPLICAWNNSQVNNREAGDLTRHRAHYDFIVMSLFKEKCQWKYALPPHYFYKKYIIKWHRHTQVSDVTMFNIMIDILSISCEITHRWMLQDWQLVNFGSGNGLVLWGNHF